MTIDYMLKAVRQSGKHGAVQSYLRNRLGLDQVDNAARMRAFLRNKK